MRFRTPARPPSRAAPCRQLVGISQSTKRTTTQLHQASLSVADLISARSLPPAANLAHQTANPTKRGWERLGDSYPQWAPSTSGYRASLKFIFSQLQAWPLHQNHGAASLPLLPAALPQATWSNCSLLWVGLKPNTSRGPFQAELTWFSMALRWPKRSP